MANQYVSKVVLEGGEVLIDLTGDTVTQNDLRLGVRAHDKSGAIITGVSTKDSDTSDATVSAAEILSKKTAYARGSKIEGTMPNRGGVTGTIGTKDGTYIIPQGYHDGSGVVSLVNVENLIAANIRNGVSVLGITGSMRGDEDEVPEVGKQVTPTFADQTITPSAGYTCFKQLLVKAIPVVRADNSAGGVTVTIG